MAQQAHFAKIQLYRNIELTYGKIVHLMTQMTWELFELYLQQNNDKDKPHAKILKKKTRNQFIARHLRTNWILKKQESRLTNKMKFIN